LDKKVQKWEEETQPKMSQLRGLSGFIANRVIYPERRDRHLIIVSVLCVN
jgi:hypothetical protein